MHRAGGGVCREERTRGSTYRKTRRENTCTSCCALSRAACWLRGTLTSVRAVVVSSNHSRPLNTSTAAHLHTSTSTTTTIKNIASIEGGLLSSPPHENSLPAPPPTNRHKQRPAHPPTHTSQIPRPLPKQQQPQYTSLRVVFLSSNFFRSISAWLGSAIGCTSCPRSAASHANTDVRACSRTSPV